MLLRKKNLKKVPVIWSISRYFNAFVATSGEGNVALNAMPNPFSRNKICLNQPPSSTWLVCVASLMSTGRICSSLEFPNDRLL